jgi:phosphohistidine phosphatase
LKGIDFEFKHSFKFFYTHGESLNFCLIRHATAAPREDFESHQDAQRPLTSKGREECKALAAFLVSHQVSLGAIVTSPYLRALQTAENICKAWPSHRPQIIVCEFLAPEGNFEHLSRFLSQIENPTVTLVGHMPELARYGGWLMGSKKAKFGLKKAGAAWIEGRQEVLKEPNKGCGVLKWLISPDWLPILRHR